MNLLERVREFLTGRGGTSYLVGGAVRDLYLNRETHDIDISVSGSAADLARAFADEQNAAFFLMDPEFDVARVILRREGSREIVDFARVRGDTIQKDLGTRDFTINAMAVDISNLADITDALIDPFNGSRDLVARQVRAISGEVFRNDPVRLLRAARLEAELDFVSDAETIGLIERDAHLISLAPMERVRDEFVRILAADNVLRNLNRLDSLDLLGRVVPEVNAMRGVTQSPPHIYDVFEHTLHAVAAAEGTARTNYLDLAQGAFGAQLGAHMAQEVAGSRTRAELVRLALLLHDIGKPYTRTMGDDGRIHFYKHEEVGAAMTEAALKRLKFSSDEVAHVTTIVRNHMRPLSFALNGITDRGIHRYFRATGDVGVDIAIHAWCDQRGAMGADSTDREIDELQAVIGRILDRYYHAREQVISPPALLNGDDVQDVLGLAPGRKIGEILDAVREGQVTGEISTREQALKFLEKFDPRR